MTSTPTPRTDAERSLECVIFDLIAECKELRTQIAADQAEFERIWVERDDLREQVNAWRKGQY